MRTLPTCSVCGKKYINNEMYNKHISTAHVENKPVAGEVPVSPVNFEQITVHFTKEVEVMINGKSYKGKDMTLPDFAIAGEIIRIAREAYGPDILA